MQREENDHATEKDQIQDKNSRCIDLEDQIPWTTIRKYVDSKTPQIKKSVRWNVPLLVGDILKLQPGNGFLDPIAFRGVYFKTVTIYGLAMRTGIRHNKGATLYTVDDGTGSVVVYYPSSLKKKKLEYMAIASRLEYELDVFKKHKTLDRSTELISSLEVMIAKIKKQVYIPSDEFKPGTKVSVFGVPYKAGTLDSVRLYAFEMISDNDINRDHEIFFIDCLTQFYTTKLPRNCMPTNLI